MWFPGRELIYQSRILEAHSSYEYNVEELFVWMQAAVKKCIAQMQEGTYNDDVNNNLNARQRTGTISRRDYWDIFPEQKDSCLSYITDGRAERYDIKGKRYIASPYKYYFTDVGLRNAQLNFRQQEENHIMENIIYNELLVRGFHVDVGVVEHTERNEEGKAVRKRLEVDFVCNLGSRRYYIQSAFAIPDREKMEQEQNSLVRIDDSFKKLS